MSTLLAILPEEVSTRPDARSDQRVKRTPHRTVHVSLVAMEACIVHQHDRHDGAADLYLAEAGTSVIGGVLFSYGVSLVVVPRVLFGDRQGIPEKREE